jgi:hypothetical protein
VQDPRVSLELIADPGFPYSVNTAMAARPAQESKPGWLLLSSETVFL